MTESAVGKCRFCAQELANESFDYLCYACFYHLQLMQRSGRPTWHQWAMQLAHLVSQRATCDRKHVGAVLLDHSHRIVATGYNGAPSGMPHCDESGHELMIIDGRKSCVRTLHAESNVLDFAGTLADGCTLYTTVIPCYDCAKRIVNVKIGTVVYAEYYESRNTDLVVAYFATAGIELIKMEDLT